MVSLCTNVSSCYDITTHFEIDAEVKAEHWTNQHHIHNRIECRKWEKKRVWFRCKEASMCARLCGCGDVLKQLIDRILHIHLMSYQNQLQTICENTFARMGGRERRSSTKLLNVLKCQLMFYRNRCHLRWSSSSNNSTPSTHESVTEKGGNGFWAKQIIMSIEEIQRLINIRSLAWVNLQSFTPFRCIFNAKFFFQIIDIRWQLIQGRGN